MQTLNLLMQREQQQRDQAQSALRLADDAAQRAREQGAQLLAYRAEYESRWSAQFNQGGTMQIVHCYRSFMLRLDQAVVMQSRQAELAAAQREQARTELLECERRVASVRKLLDRRLAGQQQTHRKHEQKHTDELAQRMRYPSAPTDGPTVQ